MTTGEKIRERREELGMTKVELARRIDVHKSTITRLESGSIDKIPYMTFIKLLIALQTSPDRLLSDEEKELVAKADELSGKYKIFEKMADYVAEKIAELPQEQAQKITGFVQDSSEEHKG